MSVVDEVRSFNRFYTREIGLLDDRLLASAFSLAEARVLYEIASNADCAAADLAARLAMDKGHFSRIVARFKTRGLVRSKPSPTHGRRMLLRLTPAGRRAFASLDDAARRQIEALLAPLDDQARARLVSSLRAVGAMLAPDRQRSAPVVLHGLRPGDLGWIAHRQAVLYASEYGWDWTYEGLVAEILGQFVAGYEPAREAAWVAEQAGEIVGSVFLVKTDDPSVAKLRLLYVEPSARGQGVGRRLVEACIGRAREIGCKTLTLWTNDVLTAARRIYQAAGFRLVDEKRHHSFGHDLVGQTWTLELAPAAQTARHGSFPSPARSRQASPKE